MDPDELMIDTSPKDVLVDGQIVLYGTVGASMFEQSFDSRSVVEALAKLGRNADVTVRLNSGGGDPFEGVAIYNAFKAHAGRVKIMVDAMAGSAASIIAMAGRPTIMRPGSMMVVHDPSGVTMGNYQTHMEAAERLANIANSMAEIYAMKTRKTVKQTRADMQAESWFGAEEAVTRAYADLMQGEQTTITASAFNYKAYAHAPASLLAMTTAKGWDKRMSTNTKELEMADNKELEVSLAKAQGELAEAKAKAAATQAASMKLAADIVAACNAAEFPAMAAEFITSGASLEDVNKRLMGAKAIKSKVESARKLYPALDAKLADQYIAAGTSPEHVAGDLLDKVLAVQGQTNINPYHQAAGGGQPPVNLNPSNIYEHRAKARKEWLIPGA